MNKGSMRAASVMGANLAVLNGVMEQLDASIAERERSLRRRKEECIEGDAQIRTLKALLAEAKQEAAAGEAALSGDALWKNNEVEAFLATSLARFDSIMARFFVIDSTPETDDSTNKPGANKPEEAPSVMSSASTHSARSPAATPNPSERRSPPRKPAPPAEAPIAAPAAPPAAWEELLMELLKPAQPLSPRPNNANPAESGPPAEAPKAAPAAPPAAWEELLKPAQPSLPRPNNANPAESGERHCEYSAGRDEPAPEVPRRRLCVAPLSVLCLSMLLLTIGQYFVGLRSSGALCSSSPPPQRTLFGRARPSTAPADEKSWLSCEHRVQLHAGVGMLSIFCGSFAAAACVFPRLVGGFNTRLALMMVLQVVLIAVSHLTRLWTRGTLGAAWQGWADATFESASARDTMSVALVSVIGGLTLMLLRASLAANDLHAVAARTGAKAGKFVEKLPKGVQC